MADIQTQMPVKITNNTNTVGITGANALQVDGSGVTQPVSIGGNVTVVGAGTAGVANSGVITVQGIASMTALKVDGSGVTQPISGTVTANAGTGNFNANIAQISGSAISTAASGIMKVGVTDSVGTSVTVGQKVMASSLPVTIASDQGVLSTSQGEISTGVVASYQTSTAIANGSVGTLTYTVTTGKTLYLKQILASASGGPCKVVVNYGAGPTTICVGFFATTSPYFPMTFAQPIPITSATAVNILITNNAGSAMDVYGFFGGHEVNA